ncbi:effector-associated constant component EACC1 [Streptomyces sp. NPDC055025]
MCYLWMHVVFMIIGGEMVSELFVLLGASGVLSALTRALAIWLRSSHPGRVKVKGRGGIEVSLDLSNPSEAARYLETLTEPDSEGR